MTDTDYEVPERYRGARTASSQRQIDPEDMLDPGQLLDLARGRREAPGQGGFAVASRGSTAISDHHFLSSRVREAAARPAGHLVCTPPEVDEAWRCVERAVHGYEEAVEARRAVDQQEKDATDKEAARVRREVAAGKNVKPAAHLGDFEALRRHHDAVVKGHADRVDSARAAYERAVAESLPRWADAVLTEVGTAHGVALAAVRAAEVASQHLAVTIEAAQVLGRAADPSARSVAWHGRELEEGLSKALEVLGDEQWTRVGHGIVLDRPVGVGGDLLTYAQRAVIASRMQWDLGEQARQEWAALLRREEREGWKFTRQGRPVAKSA